MSKVRESIRDLMTETADNNGYTITKIDAEKKDPRVLLFQPYMNDTGSSKETVDTFLKLLFDALILSDLHERISLELDYTDHNQQPQDPEIFLENKVYHIRVEINQ